MYLANRGIIYIYIYIYIRSKYKIIIKKYSFNK